MSTESKIERARRRAARLRIEAGNCLAVAVGAREVETAAQLIDEALRLRRRSAELAEEA